MREIKTFGDLSIGDYLYRYNTYNIITPKKFKVIDVYTKDINSIFIKIEDSECKTGYPETKSFIIPKNSFINLDRTCDVYILDNIFPNNMLNNYYEAGKDYIRDQIKGVLNINTD